MSSSCPACRLDVTPLDHFTSIGHLHSLTNLVTTLFEDLKHSSKEIRSCMKECTEVCNKLEPIKPVKDQQRTILYSWSGYDRNPAGLNLRHGACLLTPDHHESSTSSSSYNDKPCNLLYLSGNGSYARIPTIHLAGAITISVLVKIHHLGDPPPIDMFEDTLGELGIDVNDGTTTTGSTSASSSNNNTKLSSSASNSTCTLLRLGRSDTLQTDAIVLEASSKNGISFNIFHSEHELQHIQTPSEYVKLNEWIHILGVVEHSGRMLLWINGDLITLGQGFPFGLSPAIRDHNTIGWHSHSIFKDVQIWNIPLDMEEVGQIQEMMKERYGLERKKDGERKEEDEDDDTIDEDGTI